MFAFSGLIVMLVLFGFGWRLLAVFRLAVCGLCYLRCFLFVARLDLAFRVFVFVFGI